MIEPIKEHMQLALVAAHESKAKGDYGHGSVVVKDGQVIATGYETLKSANDPVNGHAEIDVIRKACKILQSPYLLGCVLYSTAEPCPMCMSACIWAKVDTVVYGITRDDMIARMKQLQAEGGNKFSWRQIAIPAKYLAEHGEPKVHLVPGYMREQALKLL